MQFADQDRFRCRIAALVAQGFECFKKMAFFFVAVDSPILTLFTS